MPGPMMASMQPPMIPNPAFEQWAQQAQAWIAEKQKREQQFQAACELIKTDAIKRYKIDIEADSTIAADEQAEKQARTEFLQAITPFMATVLPQMVGNPALAALGKEMILFGVRAFPVSRQLEDAFETALDQLVKAPPQPSQDGKGGNTKPPMEIAAEAETAKGKQQVDMIGNAVKLQQIQSQERIAQDKLEAQQQHDAVELSERQRERQGREILDAARIERMAARNTAGLV